MVSDESPTNGPRSRQSRGRASDTLATKPMQPATSNQRTRHRTSLRQEETVSNSISSSLDEWAIPGCPVNMWPAQKSELKAYLYWLAMRAYPLEAATQHNPVRSNKTLSSVLSDPLVLRCAICIGAVWNAMYTASGTWQTIESSSQLCSIVNAMLGELETRRPEPILAEAVATLAVLAVSVKQVGCKGKHAYPI
jgi:hypothetical protein